MDLLISHVLKRSLESGRFAPVSPDADERALYEEWSHTEELEDKLKVASRAISQRPFEPPIWALLTCLTYEEFRKLETETGFSKDALGCALDHLIFFILEAQEIHYSDVQNKQSRVPLGEDSPVSDYKIGKKASVRRAAKWVIGLDDDEFEEGELNLRKILRRPFSGNPVTFDLRTLCRAWKYEQDQFGQNNTSERQIIDGYRNTPRITRVSQIWEAWRQGDRVSREYEHLFRIVGLSALSAVVSSCNGKFAGAIGHQPDNHE